MDNGTRSLTVFLIGAAAGGAAALLFAPMSGENLRQRLAERSGELKERTTASARDAATKGREMVDGARDNARSKAAAFKGAVDEGKAAYKRELEKAKSA